MAAEDMFHFDVDVDDYGPTALVDSEVSHDRTLLTDETFASTKATYVAKHDYGSIYKSLPTALPQPASEGEARPKLSNKHVQLIQTAGGELYFFKNYQKLLDTIAWLRDTYDLEGSSKAGSKDENRAVEILSRWERRCRERLAHDNHGNHGKEVVDEQ